MRRSGLLYFALGVTTVISVGAVTNQVGSRAPAAGLALSSSSITFPDGTVQATAATSAPTALPVRCYSSTISAGNIEGLNCASGVSADSFGPTSGVAAGFFFVVSDVVIEPNHIAQTSTGFVAAEVHRTNSDGLFETTQEFKLSSDNESQHNSFAAPPFLVGEGEYVSCENSALSTTSISCTVLGYLTAEPEKLRL